MEEAWMQVAGLVLMLVGALQQLLVNHGGACAAASAMVLSCAAALVGGPVRLVVASLALANACGVATRSWRAHAHLGLVDGACGLTCVVVALMRLWAHGLLLQAGLGLAAACAPLALAIFAALVTSLPGRVCVWFREHVFHNAVAEAPDQVTSVLADGSSLVTDIRYDELPSGVLDIHYARETGSDAPTYIHLHGGGFCWGDKRKGDPLAGDAQSKRSTMAHAVAAGYNVVAMNYALSPEHPFGTAIAQLVRGLDYLSDNARTLRLDMSRVVLSGASAGGNLAATLALIHVSPDFARRVGVAPVLETGAIRACVLQAPALDVSRIGQTGVALLDCVFYTCGRVYLGTDDLTKSPHEDVASITKNLTGAFPPTMLTDGNWGTFTDQARAAHERLQVLGVPTEFVTFSVEEAGRLGHVFEEEGSPWAEEALRRTFAFLGRHV